MKTTVYLIRHGESEANKRDAFLGHLDLALTETGRAQARLSRDHLLAYAQRPSVIYASDLCRARETAENAIPDCRYEVSPLLREVNVGSLAGNPLSILDDEQRNRVAKEGYGAYGGESKEDFGGRVRAFMDQLASLDAENVALFSHGGWLRTMLDETVGLVLPRNKILCENCAVGIFEYTNGTWKLHSWINLA